MGRDSRWRVKILAPQSKNLSERQNAFVAAVTAKLKRRPASARRFAVERERRRSPQGRLRLRWHYRSGFQPVGRMPSRRRRRQRDPAERVYPYRNRSGGAVEAALSGPAGKIRCRARRAAEEFRAPANRSAKVPRHRLAGGGQVQVRVPGLAQKGQGALPRVSRIFIASRGSSELDFGLSDQRASAEGSALA